MARKTTFTATYRGPIEAMQGMTMQVPRTVPDPAKWMESQWRQQQAEQAAIEEERRREQEVLNDRIQRQVDQEMMLPTERLEQIEQEMAALREMKFPTSDEMRDAQAAIMSSQTSLMNAGLQLTEQARLQEEFVSKNAEQARATDELMQQNEVFHERIKGRHKSGLEMWNLMQEAAEANIEAERQRNAELLTQIELQRDLIEKMRVQRDEAMAITEEWKLAYRKEKDKTSFFHVNRPKQ